MTWERGMPNAKEADSEGEGDRTGVISFFVSFFSVFFYDVELDLIQ